MDYADSFTLPDADEEGVFLDEGASDCDSVRGDCPGRTGRGLQGLRDNFRGDRRDNFRGPRRGNPGAPDIPTPAGRETFYASDRRGRPELDRVNWDERPPRGATHTYGNANDPSEWFHLVPSPALRPYGGGPAPSLAYPIPAPGRGAELNGLGSVNLPTARECFAAAPAQASAQASAQAPAPDHAIKITFPQLGVIILLFVAVVLLALVLKSAGRIISCLERTVLATAEACNSVSVWNKMSNTTPALASETAAIAAVPAG